MQLSANKVLSSVISTIVAQSSRSISTMDLVELKMEILESMQRDIQKEVAHDPISYTGFNPIMRRRLLPIADDLVNVVNQRFQIGNALTSDAQLNPKTFSDMSLALATVGETIDSVDSRLTEIFTEMAVSIEQERMDVMDSYSIAPICLELFTFLNNNIGRFSAVECEMLFRCLDIALCLGAIDREKVSAPSVEYPNFVQTGLVDHPTVKLSTIDRDRVGVLDYFWKAENVDKQWSVEFKITAIETDIESSFDEGEDYEINLGFSVRIRGNFHDSDSGVMTDTGYVELSLNNAKNFNYHLDRVSDCLGIKA